MKNLQFRLLIWLLKQYTKEIDQHDLFKLNNGSNDWYIAITMDTEYPKAYREVK